MRAADGRTMLVAQGGHAFQRFFPGETAPLEVMAAAEACQAGRDIERAEGEDQRQERCVRLLIPQRDRRALSAVAPHSIPLHSFRKQHAVSDGTSVSTLASLDMMAHLSRSEDVPDDWYGL